MLQQPVLYTCTAIPERDLERILVIQITTAIHEFVSLALNTLRPRTERPAVWLSDPGD